MTACDGCKTVHPGPACDGELRRHTVNLPAWLDDLFREHVPWGERTAYLRDLIRADVLGGDR